MGRQRWGAFDPPGGGFGVGSAYRTPPGAEGAGGGLKKAIFNGKLAGSAGTGIQNQPPGGVCLLWALQGTSPSPLGLVKRNAFAISACE